MRIPPSFLCTITIGAAHSLRSTGINSPSATCDRKVSSTFSLNAKGTGRYLWNHGIASCSTETVASMSRSNPNSFLKISAYSLRNLLDSDNC